MRNKRSMMTQSKRIWITQSKRICVCLVGYFALTLSTFSFAHAETAKVPPWPEIQRVIREYFENASRDYENNDIITKSQVAKVFDKLNDIGWQVDARPEILSRVLDDSHFVVRQLRSQQGRRFMRKVSGDKMIYDRLDRISKERDGQALIRDMIKLPDGEQFALSTSSKLTPNLVDLLPKRGTGKTRKVKDYKKPTGRVYTTDNLLRELKKEYVKISGTRT